MAWTPISNTVPQYAKNSGGAAASGYYLKFYAGGTTTPINMASASDGSGLLDKCQLNTLGYPLNGSSDVFIPYIDQNYKLALYENATDADNNTFSSAAWVADNVPQLLIPGGDLDLSTYIVSSASGTARSLKEWANRQAQSYEYVSSLISETELNIGDYIIIENYSPSIDSGPIFGEIVAAGTGVADGGNYIDLTGSSTQFKQHFIDGEPSALKFGGVGDGVTSNGNIPNNNLYIPKGEFVYNETIFLENNSYIKGSGTLINNNVDEHIIALGEKQSGANAKYSYQVVDGLTLSSSSVDTDDNWALINSSADYTRYSNNTVKDSYVGLSFNKNYNYTTVADAGVSFGSIVGNIVKARFMGIEHFATLGVATAGNSVEGASRAGPGFRFTGDLDTPSYGNGINTAHDCSNGLTVQTQTVANCLVGFALTDCTVGIGIPENTTLAGGSSRHNILEGAVSDVDYGVFTYNTQYNWIRASINSAASGGMREEDTTGAAGIGDLKSNKIDLLVTNSATGAALKSSHNEITINASDIQFNCLTIDGDHNNVKLICDKANTVASTNRALVLNGTHNLVEVISTGNTAIGSSGDVLIAGNKNDVRVMTDATVRISGDNNVVRGFAASTIDIGTGNDVTGVNTY